MSSLSPGNPMLLPLIAAQGWWVRRRAEPLPEASGPTTGTTAGPGGAPLRLLVLGESTAAGCGARTHDEAFAGAFARALSERHGRRVAWTVHARNGATIRRVRERLVPRLDAGVDVTVLLIGVNDVLQRTPAREWGHALAAVLDALGARSDHLVVTGVPPFERFPSLPRALRGYLAARGRVLDDLARGLSATRPGVSWIDSTELVPADTGFFASDGFHPSPVGYERWAGAVIARASA